MFSFANNALLGGGCRVFTHTWEPGNETVLHEGGKEHEFSTNTRERGNETILQIATMLQLFKLYSTYVYIDEHIKT